MQINAEVHPRTAPKKNEDTIVAVATASGRGGVGIVRLSGTLAQAAALKVFRPKTPTKSPWPSHQFLYGHFVHHQSGELLDDGFAVRMEPPQTYTGEEVVELHLHGSPMVLDEIVGLCARNGARLAQPGEFTRRAYLNGKMDLVQAEAVADLIQAESQAEAAMARRRLEGKISDRLEELRRWTIAVLAECEADVDFPDENLPIRSRTALMNNIQQIQIVTHELLNSYVANQRLHRGYVVAIVGRPNVGKSSFFNAVLGQDRAIVTEQAGTTRDLLREELLLNGRRIRFLDTAGLRERADDVVEQIGMERSRQAIETADLIVIVCDASTGITADDLEIFHQLKEKPFWTVWNKIDLSPPPAPDPAYNDEFSLSALRGDGVINFLKALGKRAEDASELNLDGGIGNDRQRELLDQFQEAIHRGKAGWEKGDSPEFVAFEFRQAYRYLSRILGQDEGMDEVLDEIFSKFCIGK